MTDGGSSRACGKVQSSTTLTDSGPPQIAGAFLFQPPCGANPILNLHAGVAMAGSESMHAKTTRLHGHDVFPLKELSRPYRLAAHGSSTRTTRPVRVTDSVTIGGTAITVIAGPCSVESAEMIADVATRVKGLGAVMLRGGAFKPRTSPYSFSGFGEPALGI